MYQATKGHIRKGPSSYCGLCTCFQGRRNFYGYTFAHFTKRSRGHSAPFDVGQELMEFLNENHADYCDTAIEICGG